MAHPSAPEDLTQEVRDLATDCYIDGINLSLKVVNNVIVAAEHNPQASKDVFQYLELVKKNLNDAIMLSTKELKKST